MNYEIITEEDYRQALKRFMELSGKPQTEKTVHEMFLLMNLMERYERQNCSCC